MNAIEKTRLLIPLDGSAMGESALLAIHPLIRSGKVESTLLHVVETSSGAEKAEARLESRRQALEKEQVSTRVRIVSGRPAEQILRVAETGSFDLVAMATHGRTGMQRVLMGSVAEEVARSSPVPTLLCRSGTRLGEWERIVVALDGSAGSEEILGDVARLARSVGAEVHLLRVGLGLLRGDGYRGVSYQFAAENPTSYLSELALRLSSTGIPVVVDRREGIAGVEIALLARELDAGLICMTTEGRAEQVPGLDRSVAAEVIRSAPCPVYVRRMLKKPAESR